MKFPAPIKKGILIKRYKRFLSDIDLNGRIITAHCANPGAMTGVKDAGAIVWVSEALNPKRKLKYDWQVIEVSGALVCINTATANKIVEQAITSGHVTELSKYDTLRREVKYGQNSRIDFLLEDQNKPPCYVEVKNVTLSRRPPLAEFPDSHTARGTKHLRELTDMARQGCRAVMLYCVNRTDSESFDLARDIDPEYAREFAVATHAGVEVLAYGCDIDINGITLGQRLSVAVKS